MTTVTFGFWSQSQGGQAQAIISYGEGTNTLADFYLDNNWGGVASFVVDTPNNTYEIAVNDVFNSLPDTARFYATFQDVTTPFPKLTIPTIFQTEAIQTGAVFVDEVFICPAGSELFCDDYINPVGTLVGSQFWTSAGTTFPTLSGIAPGSPYDITLAIHMASTLCSQPLYGCSDFVDFANAIVVTPTAKIPFAPVPAPEVGTGLSALLALGLLLWRRRWVSQQ